MELIDLTVPITAGMPVYPGDPEVQVAAALTVAGSGVNVRRIHLGSQTGTHVDAPYHIDDSLPRLDEIPLERFTGPGVLVDARRYGPDAEIGLEAVPGSLADGAIVVIVTGWSTRWGTDEYLRHPYLGADAARALVDAGARTVAVDAASVDRTTGPDEEFTLPAHQILCRAGTVIAENLTGAQRLIAARDAGHAIEMFLFPLALAGSDGAPVRAVARITPHGAQAHRP
ncbi:MULTISPECIES: cyclase family protein [Pseudofrankia]|uniref:cyclase family protein n=1 Tax=Pseudofrankia TaxID=2994363 RepID=UPI000234C8A5|nr:cyclase family protein [Pseudofrankia sp. EUN1h]OHV34380.1 cyclase [Pseudofrankia sp. EUN1h]